MAERGYHVLGVDASDDMLQMARSKLRDNDRLSFQREDVRHLDVDRRFDACVSMFGVMSYQTTNDDLQAALCSIRQRVRSQGIFVFDVWNGIAVLRILPSTRVAEWTLGDKRVLRLAQPTLDAPRHSVDVHYHVLVTQSDRILEEAREVHRMRFWFPEELELHLKIAHFALLEMCPVLKLGSPIGTADWSIAVIAQAA